MKLIVHSVLIIHIVSCYFVLLPNAQIVFSSSSSTSTTTENPPTCELTSPECLADREGYDAIRWLHRQLDDDADGNVDIKESNEFLRDELKYENGYDRHNAFHSNNDHHITVDDLWQQWRQSEVHNWTTDQTVDWLVNSVEMAQYEEHFRREKVTGASLPRLTASSPFMTSILGIRDPIHRQRIALKAMDAVLFGAPKPYNFVKDVVLVLSLALAIGGCWFAFIQHRYSQTHLKKMAKDMESLQKAEEQLQKMQYELSKAKQDQVEALEEKEHLQENLARERAQFEYQHSINDNESQHSAHSDDPSRVSELESELRSLREQLQKAERQLELANMCWSPPQALHQWLQTTHDLEVKAYNVKRLQAERQLADAKECCEKLRKRRSTFMGSFKVAHGSTIDDVETRIAQARQALSEVTLSLQERLNRWRHIEQICGFSIVNNSQSPTRSDISGTDP